MFGQLLPVKERLLLWLLRYCALQLSIVQVGINPVDAVLGGKQAFCSFGCERTYLFYILSWYFNALLRAVGVVTCGHRSNLAAISTTVSSIVPP